MSMRDLVALVADAKNLPRLDGLNYVSAGDMTAVFETGAWRMLQRVSRKAVLNGMVRRQSVLERLMPLGTVLPVLPGTRLDPDSMDTTWAANAPVLAALSDRLSGQIQYQIEVHWPSDKAAIRFGWTGKGARDHGAADLAARVTARLYEAVGELVELPRTDDMLLNTAILMPRQDEMHLDAALEEIDALWPDGFRIRQVGPSPAVSFGSLGFRSIQPGAVRAARRALDLSQDADLEALTAARRTALMEASPEVRADLKEAAAVLEAAVR
ncbi:MAG: GvpL/GvpF family gas vesicle protein, partial [Pseudomonadota bacterium]